MTTIKDVAKAANVSITTVSRVLNYDPTLSIHPDTREKIIQISKELNFKKRVFKKKNNFDPTKIGIIQWYSINRELEDVFYLSIRAGAEAFLRKNNVQIIRSFKGDQDFIEKLNECDAIICIGKFSASEITKLRKISNKIIFVDMYLDRVIVNSISLDFRNAIYDALTYLTSLGHNYIGYLGGIEHTSDDRQYFEQRYYYFKKFCEKNNIIYTPYVIQKEFTKQSGYEMMMELIDSQRLPTAIFCASDDIAIGAMRALRERNIKIPDEISIIGFNNLKDCDYLDPPLTSINAPSEIMGEYAAMLILNLTQNKRTYPIKMLLPCNLIKRQSCCVARNYRNK